MMRMRKKKDSILKCAKKIFARKGYDSATMDEIALCARSNKALIYYYFKSKDNLFSAVLLSAIDEIYDYIDGKVDDTSEPEEALKVYIEAFFIQANKDDTFIRILTREIGSIGAHLSDKVMGKFLRVLGILDGIIEKGVRKGCFVKKDVKIVHFIVIGTVSYYLCSVPLRKRLSKRFPNKGYLLKELRNVPEELFEIVLKGLKNNG